jgi:hypothetical protein
MRHGTAGSIIVWYLLRRTSCFLSGHNRTQISRKKAEILNTELKIRNRELYESIQIQKNKH